MDGKYAGVPPLNPVEKREDRKFKPTRRVKVGGYSKVNTLMLDLPKGAPVGYSRNQGGPSTVGSILKSNEGGDGMAEEGYVQLPATRSCISNSLISIPSVPVGPIQPTVYTARKVKETRNFSLLPAGQLTGKNIRDFVPPTIDTSYLDKDYGTYEPPTMKDTGQTQYAPNPDNPFGPADIAGLEANFKLNHDTENLRYPRRPKETVFMKRGVGYNPVLTNTNTVQAADSTNLYLASEWNYGNERRGILRRNY